MHQQVRQQLLPLAGMVVVEMGHSMAASFAGQILGDLGAEVIQIEKPEGADMMVLKAATMFEAGLPCGKDANIAKLLSAESAQNAGEACLQTHGGFGYAKEYDVERRCREARVQCTAPISNNLILAYIGEHVLGMPRSY